MHVVRSLSHPISGIMLMSTEEKEEVCWFELGLVCWHKNFIRAPTQDSIHSLLMQQHRDEKNESSNEPQ